MELTQSRIDSVDTYGMWHLLNGFSSQWEEAVRLTKGIELKLDASCIKKICFAGMGGSAMGGDLIRGYSYHTCPYPVSVVRHYDIPKWVDEETLFIACSFSGNTEETLFALTQARLQSAQVIAITSGGELLLEAVKENFDYIRIPSGDELPRPALGYLFVPVFRIFQYLGYLDEGEEALEETRAFLEEQGELLADLDNNEALSLAGDMNDTLPILYSDATIMEAVNLRWREQLEENAKTLAFGNYLPEMTHNEIVGWERIIHLTGRLSVLMLFDDADNKRVQKRMSIIKDLIEDQAAYVHVLRARGRSRLTRMFSLVQLADWTSFYLAIINGVDPTPIAKIDLLKSRLADE